MGEDILNQLQTAKSEGNPIIQGGTVTFVWEGKTAPHLISDLHGWESNPQPLEKVRKGVWTISFELATDAYLEYAFYDPLTKKRFPDPLNRRSVYNGVGSYNHFLYMPGSQPTKLSHLPAGGLLGRVTRHFVPSKFLSATSTRRIDLYHPPVKTAVPLLVVYDGLDYLRRGKLAVIVDNLISSRRIKPVGIAFCQQGGSAREVEYACSDLTLILLMSQVLPLAALEMNIIDYKKKPGAHTVIGASMGGLMSVYSALKCPQVFGTAISQAGAFEFEEMDTIARQMVSYFPGSNTRFWLDCGRMDSLLETNRRMSSLMLEKGYKITYRENGGGHNYTTWRDTIPDALELLL